MKSFRGISFDPRLCRAALPEYDLFGDFTADLVVGDSVKSAFCFVEFEEASSGCLFVTNRSRSAPEWGRRFEHGFSQIVDWLWKLDDMKGTSAYRARFGPEEIRFEAMLITGRSGFLDTREEARLRWRLDRVLVDSKRVHTITLDELHSDLDQRLSLYEAAFAVEKRALANEALQATAKSGSRLNA